MPKCQYGKNHTDWFSRCWKNGEIYEMSRTERVSRAMLNDSDAIRILLSPNDLERDRQTRGLCENLGYQVELVTPEEDISSSKHFELLVITGAAHSKSALYLLKQANSIFGSPCLAISDTTKSHDDYQEVFPEDSSLEDVVGVSRSIIERRRLQLTAGIVGETDAMKQVLERVVAVAPVNSTVLVTGESGTGKELVARGIHHLSSRRHNSFIAVNLSLIHI